jgi:hypothetical protein
MTQSPDFLTESVTLLCGSLRTVLSRLAGRLQASETLCHLLLPLLVAADDGSTSLWYIPMRILLRLLQTTLQVGQSHFQWRQITVGLLLLHHVTIDTMA